MSYSIQIKTTDRPTEVTETYSAATAREAVSLSYLLARAFDLGNAGREEAELTLTEWIADESVPVLGGRLAETPSISVRGRNLLIELRANPLAQAYSQAAIARS